ncbi:hypothetical protein BC938DRAFT_483576 [Jimgerdemannia flammicorona]|uniref:Uncharacterized protein n=1 Tax=Jimgerdemannia flammicorona TaxID=994334 RepID=A0A433QBT1_9FUNG|nr:hypothetical protein BC938DRAFT_483576 [Jimgerdemannia flammicorona]
MSTIEFAMQVQPCTSLYLCISIEAYIELCAQLRTFGLALLQIARFSWQALVSLEGFDGQDIQIRKYWHSSLLILSQSFMFYF